MIRGPFFLRSKDVQFSSVMVSAAAAAKARRVRVLGAEGRQSPIGEDDGTLMRRVASGDARALEIVAERHTQMLYSVAWRMLGDPAEAEDVVQEAITRVWVKAASWTPVGGGLGGWLRRIATNLCIDRQRTRAFVADVDVPERADEAPGADVLIDEQRRRNAVAEAMQALPDRQRAVIVLTYYEGVSNADAAHA